MVHDLSQRRAALAQAVIDMNRCPAGAETKAIGKVKDVLQELAQQWSSSLQQTLQSARSMIETVTSQGPAAVLKSGASGTSGEGLVKKVHAFQKSCQELIEEMGELKKATGPLPGALKRATSGAGNGAINTLEDQANAELGDAADDMHTMTGTDFGEIEKQLTDTVNQLKDQLLAQYKEMQQAAMAAVTAKLKLAGASMDELKGKMGNMQDTLTDLPDMGSLDVGAVLESVEDMLDDIDAEDATAAIMGKLCACLATKHMTAANNPNAATKVGKDDRPLDITQWTSRQVISWFGKSEI
jgi:hypothetical protein